MTPLTLFLSLFTIRRRSKYVKIIDEDRSVKATQGIGLQPIPLEIYTEILRHLSLRESRNKESVQTLCSLSLVCKSLRDMAQTLLFQHLEPKSQKSLKLLLRVFRSKPQLACHVESVSALTFAWTVHIYNTQCWRSRWVALYPPEFKSESPHYHRILITLADHRVAMDRFHTLLQLCPNIQGLSLPIWTSFHEWDTNPFPLSSTCIIPPNLAPNLGSLTLSCVAFQILNDLEHEEIQLPELRQLTLANVTVIGSYGKHLNLPNLSRLSLRFVRGSLEGLQNFVRSIDFNLETMECFGVHVSNGPLVDPFPLLDAHLSMRRTLGITALTVLSGVGHNSTIAAVWQFPSVINLTLSTTHRSSFAELIPPLPAMQRLSICHNDVGFKRGQFLFSSLMRLLNRKDKLAPSLSEISITWTLRRDLVQRDIATVLVYCLWELCNREGVALNVAIHLVGGKHHERETLNPNRWRRKKYHFLALVDRGLRKIGREAF